MNNNPSPLPPKQQHRSIVLPFLEAVEANRDPDGVCRLTASELAAYLGCSVRSLQNPKKESVSRQWLEGAFGDLRLGPRMIGNKLPITEAEMQQECAERVHSNAKALHYALSIGADGEFALCNSAARVSDFVESMVGFLDDEQAEFLNEAASDRPRAEVMAKGLSMLSLAMGRLVAGHMDVTDLMDAIRRFQDTPDDEEVDSPHAG